MKVEPRPLPSLDATTEPPWELDQPAHQGEADAEADLGLAALREELEGTGDELGLHSDAGVGDPKHGAAALRPGGEADGAAVGRVAGGVAEEVGHHLGEAQRIGVDAERSMSTSIWWRRRVISSLVISSARATTSPSSTCSSWRTIFPVVMRATSRRSSTSRVRSRPWRSSTSSGREGFGGAGPEQRRGGDHRGERVAQLVSEHGEELVLAPALAPKPLLGLGGSAQGVLDPLGVDVEEDHDHQ